MTKLLNNLDHHHPEDKQRRSQTKEEALSKAKLNRQSAHQPTWSIKMKISFFYVLTCIILLSSIYPLPAMHSLLATSDSRNILRELKEEEDFFRDNMQNFNGQTPDWYLHSRHTRFIQAFSLITDIVGMFMGSFNAYEIQQLKSKFTELSTGHNMLVSH